MALTAIKKIAKSAVELELLRARAQGMGYIESQIAQSLGSPALAKVITRAFKIKDTDKKAQKDARKKLKEEYGVDPRFETIFGGGFGGGSDDGVSSNKISKKLNQFKETLQNMAKEIASVSTKLDAIGDQNNQILKAVQSKINQEIGQIMQNVSPSAVSEELPEGTGKSEGGIIVSKEIVETILKEKNQKIIETSTPEKPIKSGTTETQNSDQEKQKQEEPTAIPKTKETIINKVFNRTMTSLMKQYPILRVLSQKNTTKPSSSFVENNSNTSTNTSTNTESLTEMKPSGADLQPALESIAQRTPLQTTIEPDELETLLKDALKSALEELKNENPDLFSGGGGGGGILSNLPIPLKLGKGGAGATKTAGKAGAKTASKMAFKSLTKKLPLGIGALFGLAYSMPRALAGDWSGAAMEAGSGLASIVPGVGTAASVGLDAALAARDMGVMGGGSSVPLKPEDPQLSTAIPTSSGSEIIEMNRRIQSGEVAVRTTPQGTPIVQRIINNTMMPPQSDKKPTIEFNNKENTFNRLIAQDFDHPSTYSTLMG